MKLFPARRPPAKRPGTAIPPGQRVYAIGDIHGRLDLLDDLLAQIETDDAARGGTPATVIFLGDLIDRGPESAQVIERLLDLERRRPSTRYLLGNHEEVFLATLAGDVNALKFFNRIGGKQTIHSYGVTEAEYADCSYPELLEMLIARVPATHVAFLRRFEDIIILGDYAFVHAGVRPEAPLARQKLSDLRWIRDEFLDHRGTLEKMIVHGHNIADEVEERGHRIGLDTGAFASGKLTAMGFEEDRRWLLQT
jgi:serine/threonine protein phosphatase 1